MLDVQDSCSPTQPSETRPAVNWEPGVATVLRAECTECRTNRAHSRKESARRGGRGRTGTILEFVARQFGGPAVVYGRGAGGYRR